MTTVTFEVHQVRGSDVESAVRRLCFEGVVHLLAPDATPLSGVAGAPQPA